MEAIYEAEYFKIDAALKVTRNTPNSVKLSIQKMNNVTNEAFCVHNFGDGISKVPLFEQISTDHLTREEKKKLSQIINIFRHIFYKKK